MKKLLASVLALVLSGALAYAASLTPITGPQDPSQLNATINQLQQNINAGVNGIVAVQTGIVTSTATTVEQILASATVSANTLAKNGQMLAVSCDGNLANTPHAGNIVKLYFGTSSIASASTANTGQAFNLRLNVIYAASPTSAEYTGTGYIGTSGITPVATANNTDNLASALLAKCTVAQGVASASDTVLLNFRIDQVK